MVKPYCEDCGKHRGSHPYCCDAETKRIEDGAMSAYVFVGCTIVAVLIVIGVIEYLTS